MLAADKLQNCKDLRRHDGRGIRGRGGRGRTSRSTDTHKRQETEIPAGTLGSPREAGAVGSLVERTPWPVAQPLRGSQENASSSMASLSPWMAAQAAGQSTIVSLSK